eukprot:CAMPEP_0170440852 /NCGR_PEP_ID=MMETSP0117_2-20130122/46565_1 /TAXON_ID=400756 /ORGANISM="Durinskia baltica, Strain CSIRO CS-38" /LENGTH=46 /DNA_ID= /DNA_START= /DNA_END= /DNA_ORIENTATION=
MTRAWAADAHLDAPPVLGGALPKWALPGTEKQPATLSTCMHSTFTA